MVYRFAPDGSALQRCEACGAWVDPRHLGRLPGEREEGEFRRTPRTVVRALPDVWGLAKGAGFVRGPRGRFGEPGPPRRVAKALPTVEVRERVLGWRPVFTPARLVCPACFLRGGRPQTGLAKGDGAPRLVRR